jgi:hypothetical protein
VPFIPSSNRSLDRIEKDTNQRVQDAVWLVFAQFAELQSVRQVHVWLRDEGITLPTACHSAADGRGIVWRPSLYNTVHNILTNPVFAGAYAFGRTTSKVSVENGRKRVPRGLRRHKRNGMCCSRINTRAISRGSSSSANWSYLFSASASHEASK